MVVRRRAYQMLLFVVLCGVIALSACGQQGGGEVQKNAQQPEQAQQSTEVVDSEQTGDKSDSPSGLDASNKAADKAEAEQNKPSAEELRAALSITELYHDELAHGQKPASCQKYIVMHDTEGGGTGENVVDYWLSAGKFVAAHFVVNKDGSIVQCVPMDQIAHHAGYGNTGHNQKFGVEDESRDDKRGTVPIGDDLADYGMNSYSIGIEMIHEGATGEDYPEEQLEAVDRLIAYIDAYYGNKSEIIDHKTWRLYNSDCSKEFDQYMENYGKTRTHDGSKA